MTVLQKAFEDKSWAALFKKAMLISLLFHLLASFFSLGFHHFDEHFQIVEFASAKLGITPYKELTWEYEYKVRPWLQPWFYFIQAKGLMALGLSDRHFLMFVFRLSSALIGWLSLGALGVMSYKWFSQSEKMRRFALYALCFVWFLPYIHARTSSDNLSASFMILGFTLPLLFYPYDENQKSERIKVPWGICLLTGLLLGLTFQFRNQVAPSIFFFCLWLLLFGRFSIGRGLFMSAILVSTLGIGLVVDHWGYGEWLIPFFNIYEFVIVKNVAGNFFPNPWWFYFWDSFLKGVPPLSIVFILGTLLFWIKNWKHPLTWVTLPLFLVHVLLQHKELRFIFIIVDLVPLMALFSLGPWFFERRKLFMTFVALNMIVLLVACLRPVNKAMTLYKHIDAKNPAINLLYWKDENPYTMLGAKLRFFIPSALTFSEVKELSDLKNQKRPFWMITTKGRDYVQMKELFPECRIDYSSYPEWTLQYNYGDWVKRSKIWMLFECR